MLCEQCTLGICTYMFYCMFAGRVSRYVRGKLLQSRYDLDSALVSTIQRQSKVKVTLSRFSIACILLIILSCSGNHRMTGLTIKQFYLPLSKVTNTIIYSLDLTTLKYFCINHEDQRFFSII